MATLGGPAQVVSVQTGGQQQGGAAIPVAVVTDGRGVVGGPAIPVYVVTSGPVQGGPALPVVAAATGRTVQGGAAIPVYVVSGSLGGAVPANLTLPVISGIAGVGQTLTTTDGTWANSPTGFSYQWYRGGVAIGGATANTYVLTASDPGTTITVTVTATNASGSASATSAGVAVSSLHSALSVYYKLADVSDSTANALTLTNNNVATFVPGKIGDAVNLLSASAQFLSRANNALLRPHAVNGFTIAAWFNRTNTAAAHNMVTKGPFSGNNTEYALFGSNGINRVEIFVGNGAALANINASVGIGALGTWNFVILKSDGATVSIRLNDGVPVTTPLVGVVSGGAGAFNIGAVNGIATWNGMIDAVGFWQRALTAAEETALWNGGVGIEYPF